MRNHLPSLCRLRPYFLKQRDTVRTVWVTYVNIQSVTQYLGRKSLCHTRQPHGRQEG